MITGFILREGIKKYANYLPVSIDIKTDADMPLVLY